ncbi:MAG: lysophospholipid acyltransferase family protein [Salibacteraceae bacterium]
MEWFFKPFRALFKIYFFVVFFGSLMVLYPLFWWLLHDPKRHPQCFAFMKHWGSFLQLMGGFTLVRHLKEPLPEPPYIVVPNHSSYLDIILMYNVIPDYFAFMGKAELNNWPLFGIFFRKKMNISVDRGSRIAAARALVAANRELDSGHGLIIFAEGTIPPHAPKLKAFKNGAFKLAIDKQVPIVPVTFTRNWRLIQSARLFKGLSGPGFAPVHIHPAVSTKGLTEEDLVDLREQVFHTIQQPLLEHESGR